MTVASNYSKKSESIFFYLKKAVTPSLKVLKEKISAFARAIFNGLVWCVQKGHAFLQAVEKYDYDCRRGSQTEQEMSLAELMRGSNDDDVDEFEKAPLDLYSTPVQEGWELENPDSLDAYQYDVEEF